MSFAPSQESGFVPKVDLTQSLELLASTRCDDSALTDQQVGEAEVFREKLRETFKKEFHENHQPHLSKKDKNERLQTYLKSYKRSIGKEGHVSVDRAYIESELKKELALMRDEPQDSSFEFTLSKCSSATLQMTAPTFTQPTTGLCSPYSITEAQAIAFLSNETIPISLKEIALSFGASNLTIPPEKTEKPRDIIGNLEKLVDAAVTAPVLNFASPESVALFTELCFLLVSGMKRSIVYTTDRITSYVERLPTDRASNVSLQAAFMRAKSSPKRKTPMKYVADLLASLAFDAQLSVFFRFLADAVVFKQKYYYADADIFTYDTCQRIADLVERVEALDFVGEKSIEVGNPTVIPRLSLMEKRVMATLREYLSSIRTSLIEKKEVGGLSNTYWVEAAKLFVDCLLTQDNGQLATLAQLWDLFRAIDAFKCQHAQFPAYKRIFGRVSSAMTMMSDSKAAKLIYKLHKHGLVPYVFIFLASDTRVPFKGFYWQTIEGCLRLANSFKPVAECRISMDRESFLASLRVALAL